MALKQLSPLPTTTLEVEPSREEVEFFIENSYLVVERITTDEELAWLTELYEHIFDEANAGDRGAPVDRSTWTGTEAERRGPAEIGQAFLPEVNYPELLQTTFNRNARRYAAALLDEPIGSLGCWGHMIRKLPGARSVPWHQDEAFWEPELRYHALGCWLPLHGVTEEHGAMQFIPRSHRRGVLVHHALDGDVMLHVLEVSEEIDPSQAVVCPLPAGGATFHHSRTLHHTAANTTDRPRLAFPFEFEVRPTFRDVPATRPWVDEWRAASGAALPAGHVADGQFYEF
jgi:Phytanoyl-CoA dioxygenase (PhyH)